MSTNTLLIILLVVVLFGSFPAWSYNRNWGYGPSGIVGAVLIVLLVLLLTGRLNIH